MSLTPSVRWPLAATTAANPRSTRTANRHLHLPIHGAANPNASTPDDQWTSFGGFYLDTLYPNTTNQLRHLYEFDPISGVTGVRILTCSDGADFASYTCIDEIEVYAPSVPEPGTLALLAAGLLGLIGCVAEMEIAE